jgi:hypothetical protein
MPGWLAGLYTKVLQLSEYQMMTLELPFDINITNDGNATRLASGLRNELVDSHRVIDSHGELATHTIESLLLALVAEGVDLSGPAGCRAVHTAVQSVAEYLCRLDQ